MRSSFQTYLKLPYLNTHAHIYFTPSFSSVYLCLWVNTWPTQTRLCQWQILTTKENGGGYEEKFHRKIGIYDQALNYMERCLTSITIREIQIKTRRYHFPPDWWNHPKFRSLATYVFVAYLWGDRDSDVADSNSGLYNSYWLECGLSSQAKLCRHERFDLAIPIVGTDPKNPLPKILKRIRIQISIAAYL